MSKLLDDGKKLRVVGATNMNKNSSRSHAVFTIYFTEKKVAEGKKRIVNSKINVVDLAGSERSEKTGATGARLQEGSNINKSLTYLGTVIEKLSENMTKGTKHHIPYRNSQLTLLLSESLGGNSKTIMIAALSPAAFNYEETLSTLRFADRVASIQTTTTANVDEEAAELKKLQAEIEKLKADIDHAKKNQKPGETIVVKKKRERPPGQEPAEGEEAGEGEEEVEDEDAIR